MEKHIIKQILFEQKEEISRIFTKKIIDREILHQIKSFSQTELIKVIMGVRRCGKSTLAHQILKDINYGYINFDDERLPGIKSIHLNDFIEVLNEIEPGCNHLLLDEVQNVEGWELFVNRLKRNGYNIFITGSNSQLLSKELATHLTGRYISIELFPFSFREFLQYKEIYVEDKDHYIAEKIAIIKRTLEEYIQTGGFPEILDIIPKNLYLRELFDKIISRDIVFRYNIRYVKDLKEIALYAISNYSSKSSLHKIKNIFEIKSVHTVKNYLQYLEDAYLLFLLVPFSFKLKEQLKQPKKIYSIDTGIINALSFKAVADHGKIMENVVLLELKRRNKEIYYYSASDFEVDFLIREGQKIDQLIKVCFSLADEYTKKREIKALIKAAKKLDCSNLLIITFDNEGKEKVDDLTISIIPLWKWLLT
ncbi:MAG: ATP-binding protein [Cytophagales bacterium]|nr:ATP-binding protein [Cytophagales bacterium]